jgi:hypothetical protein
MVVTVTVNEGSQPAVLEAQVHRCARDGSPTQNTAQKKTAVKFSESFSS